MWNVCCAAIHRYRILFPGLVFPGNHRSTHRPHFSAGSGGIRRRHAWKHWVVVCYELHWQVFIILSISLDFLNLTCAFFPTGRRTLLLTGIVLNAFCLMSVGIAGCFTTTAAMYYIGYVMNFAQLFYSPTVGAVSWTISAEVSSVKARAKTQSLAIVTNALVSWAMNFIAPYLINTDQGQSLLLEFDLKIGV